MIKYEQEDLDNSLMRCVNPQDVVPALGTTQPTNTNTEQTNMILNGKFHCGVDGVPNTQEIQNTSWHMEEFVNLESLIPGAKSKYLDELNTPQPTFGKFDFAIQPNNRTSSIQNVVEPSLDLPQIKWDNDPFKQHFNNNNNIYTDIKFKNMDMPLKGIEINYLPDENEFLQSSELSYNNTEMKIDSETPIYVQQSIESIDNYNTYQIDQEAMQIPSDHEYCFKPQEPLFPITETALIRDVQMMPDVRSKLQLNINFKLAMPQDIPNTPDVIDTLVNLESERFNLLEFLNDKEYVAVDPKEILPVKSNPPPLTEEDSLSIKQEEESPLPSPSLSRSSPPVTPPPTRPKRVRKRKSYDSDEEYIPPSEKLKKSAHFEDSDDSSCCSTATAKPVAKRGRGRPRISSFSSDSSKTSKTGGVSKYRELRDKNNEASRKSRLKRRIKEMEIETEQQSLEDRNVKLKAEVEELERMVTSFRNNLFKVILKT